MIREIDSIAKLPQILADLDFRDDREVQDELERKRRVEEVQLWESVVVVLGTFGTEENRHAGEPLSTEPDRASNYGPMILVWLSEELSNHHRTDSYPDRTEAILIKTRTIRGREEGPERELYRIDRDKVNNWMARRAKTDQLWLAAGIVSRIKDSLDLKYPQRVSFPRR